MSMESNPAEDRSTGPDDAFLHNCMYFTANRLSRAITRMADEAFATTGLTPAYGYLIRLVVGKPGITQKELSEKLYITPSTLTRFIDKLEGKRLVERKVQGKTVLVYPTGQGIELVPALRQASKKLKEAYVAVLGEDMAEKLTLDLETTSERLER
ncbi:MarR family winged helix-turn-helix transcriptional regulator [Paenibacillus arenilitoris]|uniref:MarR family transcriptional regulator n=1 Tax=Paenibacillus arenilitoris TaxID=2772299 RepID=A0A927H762_9BACL|nr:MarR family transcriptional regulator [Paenibacillus arenilitoris]MBD2870318.1 MarR family transcriptional regulator [Paenibacillus arenilitoris]